MTLRNLIISAVVMSAMSAMAVDAHNARKTRDHVTQQMQRLTAAWQAEAEVVRDLWQARDRCTSDAAYREYRQ